MKYDDDDDSQGYDKIKEAFKALTEVNILNPFTIDLDFRSSNEGDAIGYSLYVFDLRYQKNLKSAQLKTEESKISKTIPAEVYGYPLVLTN